MDQFFAYINQTYQPDLVTWVIMPLFIFVARVVDVSLGTIRIVFTSRGKYLLAPILGFIEVFIWIVAVSQLVRNIHSLVAYLAYAAGFALGTFLGLQIERRLAMGKLVLRIIVQEAGDDLARLLHDSGHGITVVDAHGSTGSVKLIYTIIERRDLKEVEDLIVKGNPRAFLSVEEISETRAGYFPNRPTPLRDALFGRKNK